MGYKVRSKVSSISSISRSQHPSGMPVTNMLPSCLKRKVSSICEWATQEKGPDQPDYREKSMSKSTRIMVCEENQKNSVNIEEDSKSSAETSTYDIPSYKYNDAYLGQRYVTELGGNNDDENNKVNENENNRPKRLKFNPQVLVTVYDNKSQDDDTSIIKRLFYLKSQSILPLILQPTYISIRMPIR